MNTEHISKHARKKLKTRTSLTNDDLALLLDKSPTMSPLPGIHKEFVVIYSIRDKKSYIAIRDTVNGSVISVWYLRYYEQKYGKIENTLIESSKKVAGKLEDNAKRSIVELGNVNKSYRVINARKALNIKVHFKGGKHNKRSPEVILSFYDFDCNMDVDSDKAAMLVGNLTSLMIKRKLIDCNIDIETVSTLSCSLNKIGQGYAFDRAGFEKDKLGEMLSFLRDRLKNSIKKKKAKRKRKRQKERVLTTL